MEFKEEDIKKSRDLSEDFFVFVVAFFGGSSYGYVGGSADMRKTET